MKIESQLKIVIAIALAGFLISYLWVPPQPQLHNNQEATKQVSGNGLCLAGCPTGQPGDQIVIHHVLELANNPQTKFADWVAYKITPETIGKSCKRTWAIDPDLTPLVTLEPKDYRDIRTTLQSDRGHQAPLASLCGSPYWYEADYLSNITPQKTDLNEGEWEHLETAERRLVIDGITTAVYSITGPLYEQNMPDLPHAHLPHKVPSGYWKIISLDENGEIEAVAFAIEQDAQREANFCNDNMAITDLEKRTHLKFFPELLAENMTKMTALSAQRDMLSKLGCAH